MLTADLPTSRGGSPLDKVYKNSGYSGQIEVGLLESLLSSNTGATVPGMRPAAFATILKKIRQSPDHRPIFAQMLFGTGVSKRGRARPDVVGNLEAYTDAEFEIVENAGGGNCIFESIGQDGGCPPGYQRPA
jgi:hypothetical protein